MSKEFKTGNSSCNPPCNSHDRPIAANWRRCRVYLAYTLALLVFSGLALWLLPNLKEVAAALGTAEALGALGQPPDWAAAASGVASNMFTEAWGDLLAEDPRFQGVLPDIAALAGLLLLGKISLWLTPLLLLLGALALLLRRGAPLALQLGLSLGLGHCVFAALLLGRAAYALVRAPEFYLGCLAGSLQNFAGGGYILWLGAVVGLLALLWLARRCSRA